MYNDLTIDYLCIGGGVSAGYWADEMVSMKIPLISSVCIISPQPSPLAPYEIPSVSKGLLSTDETKRNFMGHPDSFPYTPIFESGSTHPSTWYAENSIQVLWGYKVTNVSLNDKIVICHKIVNGSYDTSGVSTPMSYRIHFGRVVIATGLRAKTLNGSNTSTFVENHPDIVLHEDRVELMDPNRYIFDPQSERIENDCTYSCI